MAKMVAAIACVVFVVGCEDAPESKIPAHSVAKIVVDKDRRIVVENETHYDIWSGKFRSLPTPKEEFFLFAEDGSALKVSFEEWHRYKVGESVSSARWRLPKSK